MKSQMLTALFASALAVTPVQAAAPTPAVTPTLEHYARIVHANYEDALTSAKALQQAIHAFLAAPSAQTQQAAQVAWRVARESYGQTEAYRFYGGPIDNDNGPEGRLNAWPMDESFVDKVAGNDAAGLINDKRFAITKEALAGQNERGGEENIATGYHAIEFLLWGQDMNEAGAGNRPHTDYTTAANADRRAQYLKVATELLIDDLNGLVSAWRPHAALNYRAQFVRGGDESLRKIFVALGSLSRGELAGERLEVALNSQDQEDEHSCFSDNTHRDAVLNALGIENVWLGRFVRANGEHISGPSLRDLVAARAPDVAARTSTQIAQSVAHARAIQAPFDREIIGGKDAPGRQRIQATVNSLVKQSRDVVAAANAIGITRLTLVQP